MPKTEVGSGVFSTELLRDDGSGRLIDYWDQPVPEFLAELVPEGSEPELVVEFIARVWHQEMSMYGGPDRLGWPEEHSDEREWRSVYLILDKDHRLVLEMGLAERVFDHYSDRIMDCDVEFPEDDRY